MKAVRYGQCVLGPPGSGKSTYCHGMQQYLQLLGRDVSIINLDPANEGELPYDCSFNICEDVVSLSSVMKKWDLGPNGGLVYSMEYVLEHVDEIIRKITPHLTNYVIFDLPGQVELVTHSDTVKVLFQKICELDIRLTAVQLVDSVFCTSPEKFLSACLLSTTSMLRLELPTVNVLSKIDLLGQYSELPMQFEFFTECNDLDRLLPFLLESTGTTSDEQDSLYDDDYYQNARRKRQNNALNRKYRKLHQGIAELVEDFSLLSFLPLDISNAASVGRVLARIDKSNGYIFVGESNINESLFQSAVAHHEEHYEITREVQERVTET